MNPPDILVNGAARSWRPDESIESLVATVVTSTRGIAVALDHEVVPRSEWPITIVEPGAIIEIVTAAAGG